MLIDRRRLLSGAAIAGVAAGAPRAALAQTTSSPVGQASRQAPGYYRYSVGDIEVTAVNDGYAERPLEGYVKNAPIGEVEAAATNLYLPPKIVRVPYTTMVLRTGGKTVLIDTGLGDMGPSTTGAWMANFKAAGFDPTLVDVVILSHFHGDHINGARLKDGVAVFPKAEVMAPAPEWAFWMDDAKMEQASAPMKAAFRNVRRVLSPIAQDVKQFAADKEIVPGVTSVAAYGHTPGHMAFAITSGNGRLMMLSDTTNHAPFFLKHPDWHVLFDMDPEEAARTRRRMADLAVTERMQVAFYHAPFPSTGFIEKDGSGYRLVPVQWT